MSDFAKLVDFLTIVPENNTFSSETLILAGNSIPELILATGRFCQKESSIKRVVFVGGIGHGTQRLLANCQQRFPELFKQEWINFSEAEIMRELFLTICSRKLELLLEKKSTNTGENARFSFELFRSDAPKSFWLVQDPLLQMRSHYTFSKEWHLPLAAIQPLFFERPILIDFQTQPHFKNAKMDSWWQPDYFLSLVIGEIRRLNDDSFGYGPKGANFIPHVEVPETVLASYHRCHKQLVDDVRE